MRNTSVAIRNAAGEVIDTIKVEYTHNREADHPECITYLKIQRQTFEMHTAEDRTKDVYWLNPVNGRKTHLVKLHKKRSQYFIKSKPTKLAMPVQLAVVFIATYTKYLKIKKK